MKLLPPGLDDQALCKDEFEELLERAGVCKLSLELSVIVVDRLESAVSSYCTSEEKSSGFGVIFLQSEALFIYTFASLDLLAIPLTQQLSVHTILSLEVLTCSLVTVRKLLQPPHGCGPMISNPFDDEDDARACCGDWRLWPSRRLKSGEVTLWKHR